MLQQDLGLYFLNKDHEKHWEKNDYLKSIYSVLPSSPPPSSSFVFLSLNAFIYGKPDSLPFSAQLDIYVRHLRLKAYYLNSTLAKQSEVHILRQDIVFSKQSSI